MALDISSSFWIQPYETHVSPLTSIPPQVKQNEEIESKDGDQWDLHLERHVERLCLMQISKYNRLNSRYLTRKKSPALRSKAPLQMCAGSGSVISHMVETWKASSRVVAVQSRMQARAWSQTRAKGTAETREMIHTERRHGSRYFCLKGRGEGRKFHLLDLSFMKCSIRA